jgi:hypothetical protein
MSSKLCILLSSAAIALGALAVTPALAQDYPAPGYGSPAYGAPPPAPDYASAPNPLAAPFGAFGVGGGRCHTVTDRITSFPGQLDWREYTVCS